ncbi:hypothetical protein SAMN05216388_102529 [Halorientalis persicus]|uniref:Uncharacterized protein n=1 Tax=Halorientalis persicus TaxID=1367881 RepID=A0A1H8U255_9EURY|nr:hypothetical protein [Halorientalis persicus]SEO97352.1 hypothetical protein SAMN05216388_102529 [Halorientalis persicus]
MATETDDRECPICGDGSMPICDRCGWATEEERGIDEIPHRLTPAAQALGEDVVPVEHGFDGFGPLRRLTSASEQRLAVAGYNHQHVGVECVSLTEWKAKRQAATRTPLFEYLLRDSVEVHLWFYTAYHGYTSIGALRENCTGENKTAAGSEHQVVKTFDWLQSVNAPTEYPASAPIESKPKSRSVDVDVPDQEDTSQSSLADL